MANIRHFRKIPTIKCFGGIIKSVDLIGLGQFFKSIGEALGASKLKFEINLSFGHDEEDEDAEEPEDPILMTNDGTGTHHYPQGSDVRMGIGFVVPDDWEEEEV